MRRIKTFFSRVLPMLLLAAAVVLLAGLLTGFSPLAQAGGGLAEPWATIIFVVAVPLIVQAVLFVADRYGKEPATHIAQGLSLLLAFGYVVVTRGFAGLVTPTFPAWTPADIVGFGIALLVFAGLWVQLLLAAGGSVEIAYRIVMKAVMEGAGFASKRKLAARAARLAAKKATAK